VANAGHVTAAWSECAAGFVRTFIATHATGDTRCAADVTTPFHGLGAPATGFVPYRGVGRFPLHVASDDRVARVAAATVVDAFMRAERMTGSSGRGLRGGGYTVAKGPATTTIDLGAVRYSDDVAVSGTATRDRATNAIDADVTIGWHGRQGTLRFHGVLSKPSQPDGEVTGTIGGHAVSVRVPMS
jgi:hypothetical protein